MFFPRDGDKGNILDNLLYLYVLVIPEMATRGTSWTTCCIYMFWLFQRWRQGEHPGQPAVFICFGYSRDGDKGNILDNLLYLYVLVIPEMATRGTSWTTCCIYMFWLFQRWRQGEHPGQPAVFICFGYSRDGDKGNILDNLLYLYVLAIPEMATRATSWTTCCIYMFWLFQRWRQGEHPGQPAVFICFGYSRDGDKGNILDNLLYLYVLVIPEMATRATSWTTCCIYMFWLFQRWRQGEHPGQPVVADGAVRQQPGGACSGADRRLFGGKTQSRRSSVFHASKVGRRKISKI